MSATPAETRQLLRTLDRPTSGLCPGYIQTNLVILPSAYAAAFEQFCRINCRPCPLLYVSQAGQFAAPPLAQDSDVRDQVPAYLVYEYGKQVARVTDIHALWNGDLVCFYIGCSFSFENALISAGVPVRNAEQGRNVSMYRTNRDCEPVPPFHCKMIVSMRPIPAGLVPKAAEATAPYVLAHGAPVHCGDPAQLGITDLASPDFGQAVDFAAGDVACFWACGVTAIMAASSAAVVPLLITHAPGHMFITDLHENSPMPPSVAQHVTWGRSLGALQAVNEMERLIVQDPGQRGIAALARCTELWRAANDLLAASTVVITTGFPCCMQYSIATESDGPSGAVAIARALAVLGKNTIVLVDDANAEVVKAVLRRAAAICPALEQRAKLELYSRDNDANRWLDEQRPDALVAIERAGRSPSGEYLTMRARVMANVAPIDDLFVAANARQISTIGIGDGGNELGMGKVGELIATHIAFGEQIRAVVAARHVIVAGVSNWGGYALAAALAVLARDAASVTTDDLASMVVTVEEEQQLLEIGFHAGMHDGLKPEQEMSVDGLPFRPHHSRVLEQLRELAGLGNR